MKNTSEEKHQLTPPPRALTEQQQQDQTLDDVAEKNITELGPFDVILGRGTGPNETSGNIRYRALARKMLEKFINSNTFDASARGQLAMEIVANVKATGGRFVRKRPGANEVVVSLPDNSNQKAGIVMNRTSVVYEEVPDSIAVSKARQSFRHQMKSFAPRGGSSQKTTKMTADEAVRGKFLSQQQAGYATSVLSHGEHKNCCKSVVGLENLMVPAGTLFGTTGCSYDQMMLNYPITADPGIMDGVPFLPGSSIYARPSHAELMMRRTSSIPLSSFELGLVGSADAGSSITRLVPPFLVDGDALVRLRLRQEQAAKEERSRRLLELDNLLHQQVLRRLQLLGEAQEAAKDL